VNILSASLAVSKSMYTRIIYLNGNYLKNIFNFKTLIMALDKEHFEIEKLKLEIQNLKKPWEKRLKKRQIFFTAITTIVSLWILYRTADFTVKSELLNITEKQQKIVSDSLDSKKIELNAIQGYIASKKSEFRKTIDKLKQDSAKLRGEIFKKGDTLLRKEKDLDQDNHNLTIARLNLTEASRYVGQRANEAGSAQYNSLCYIAIKDEVFAIWKMNNCDSIKSKITGMIQKLSQVQGPHNIPINPIK
jgi:hypothetical protein